MSRKDFVVVSDALKAARLAVHARENDHPSNTYLDVDAVWRACARHVGAALDREYSSFDLEKFIQATIK